MALVLKLVLIVILMIITAAAPVAVPVLTDVSHVHVSGLPYRWPMVKKVTYRLSC